MLGYCDRSVVSMRSIQRPCLAYPVETPTYETRGAQETNYLPQIKIYTSLYTRYLVCTYYLVLYVSLRITGNSIGAIKNDCTGKHQTNLPISITYLTYLFQASTWYILTTNLNYPRVLLAVAHEQTVQRPPAARICMVRLKYLFVRILNSYVS